MPVCDVRGSHHVLLPPTCGPYHWEMQVLQELQAHERLKTLVKMPSMVLDPEEKRMVVFRSTNALVLDPYGAAGALSVVSNFK